MNYSARPEKGHISDIVKMSEVTTMSKVISTTISIPRFIMLNKLSTQVNVLLHIKMVFKSKCGQTTFVC
jgi:hypothetical protein